MHSDTDSAGTGGFVINWVGGDDADGGYWAITKHGRRRVVPGTDGQVAAAED